MSDEALALSYVRPSLPDVGSNLQLDAIDHRQLASIILESPTATH